MSRPSQVRSQAEETLALHLRAAKLPAGSRQFEFAKSRGRNWRFDFCWPDRSLAVEIEGAQHGIKRRFRGDLDKYLAAQLLGWTLLRFSPRQVESGLALDVLFPLLEGGFVGSVYGAGEKAARRQEQLRRAIAALERHGILQHNPPT